MSVAGPLQLVLRSVYEARTVRFQVGPAERPERSDELDPWSVEIPVRDDAPIGAEESRAVERTLRMDCSICMGAGEEFCVPCDGTGDMKHPRRTCSACDGSGMLPCPNCKGLGGVLALPTVWSRVEEHVATRQLGTDALPLEVAFALLDTQEGTLLHHQEAPRIHDLQTREGGYRGASGNDAWAKAVRELCDAPGLPPNVRILRQRLEVRRVPVYAVRLADGTTFHLWGENEPEIHPPRALRTLAGRFSRVLPWIAD